MAQHRIIIAILILAAILRLVALDKGISLEESSSIHRAFSSTPLPTLREHNHPPLYFLLLKSVGSVSRQDWFLRLPSVAFGLGTVLCLWFWIKRYTFSGAVVACLLIATHPFIVRHSQQMRSYGLLLFLTALAFCLADGLSWKTSDSRRAIWLTLTLSIAIASHLSAIFLWSTVLFFVGIRLLHQRRLPGINLLTVAVIPPMVLVFLTQVFLTKVRRETWWIERPEVDRLLQIGADLAGASAFEWSSRSLAGKAGFLGMSSILLLTLVMVLGLAVLICGRWQSPSLALLSSGLVWLAQLVLVSALIVPVLIARTAFPLLIPIIGAVGIRWGSLRPGPTRIAVGGAVVITAMIFSLWWIRIAGPQPFGPWKQTAAQIEDEWRPGDQILFSPSYVQDPILHYNPWLPTGATHTFNPWQESQDTVVSLTDRMAPTGPGDCSRLWMITRHGPLILGNQELYEGLLTLLESRWNAPRPHFRTGIVTVDLFATAGCRETDT